MKRCDCVNKVSTSTSQDLINIGISNDPVSGACPMIIMINIRKLDHQVINAKPKHKFGHGVSVYWLGLHFWVLCNLSLTVPNSLVRSRIRCSSQMHNGVVDDPAISRVEVLPCLSSYISIYHDGWTLYIDSGYLVWELKRWYQRHKFKVSDQLFVGRHPPIIWRVTFFQAWKDQ